MVKYLIAHVVSVSKQMKELEESESLKGTLSAEQQLALISTCTDLKAAVEGATFVQVSKDFATPSKQFRKVVKSCAEQLMGNRVQQPDQIRIIVLVKSKVCSFLVS